MSKRIKDLCYEIIPHQETQTKPIFTNNSPFLIPTTGQVNFNNKEVISYDEISINDQ